MPISESDVEASALAAQEEMDRITVETLGAQLANGYITPSEAATALEEYVARTYASDPPAADKYWATTQEFPQVEAAE